MTTPTLPFQRTELALILELDIHNRIHSIHGETENEVMPEKGTSFEEAREILRKNGWIMVISAIIEFKVIVVYRKPLIPIQT